MIACRHCLQHVPLDRSAHAGLLLSRYLKVPVKEKAYEKAKPELLQQACEASCQAQPIYRLAFERRVAGFAKDCQTWTAEVQGRLIVGLGGENVLETGLTLHHTYGVPFIPGSALKGLAAHYCAEVWGGAPDGGPKFGVAGDAYRALFGHADEAGFLVIHDAWLDPESLKPNRGLVRDVMTPHHTEYYGGKAAPTDFDEPTPIAFLSIAGSFHFALSSPADLCAPWLELARNLLTEALAEWGAGGKTNAGYGRIGAGSSAATAKAAPAEDLLLTSIKAIPANQLASQAAAFAQRIADQKDPALRKAAALTLRARFDKKAWKNQADKAWRKNIDPLLVEPAS